MEWSQSLGPVGPCLLLVGGGVLMILGSLFRWRWLYPGHSSVRGCREPVLRVLLFAGGIAVIAAGILFLVFRDHLIGYD